MYDVCSTHFAKPGGLVEELPDFLQDGFHDVRFLFVIAVGFSLFPYLHLRRTYIGRKRERCVCFSISISIFNV